MKVLFISIDVFSIGGIQRYSRYLIEALRRCPAISDVRLASWEGPRDGGFDTAPAADLTGRRSIAGMAAFVVGCWRLARSSRASLVVVDHVHMAPIAWSYRLLTGTPYWLNVYAIEVWGPLSWLRRRALLGAACVVSDCEFTRRYLSERYPSLAARMVVIPDCVDVERFAPAEGGEPRELPVVLTVSRLAEGRSKGHDAVLRALASLRQEGVQASYVIAGDGPDRPRIERLASDLGLSDRVRFEGRVPDAELPALYRSCDVFALVSAFQTEGAPQGEGVPLVVLEAQASGVPAVTSALDGSAESIVDGETGFLVDPGDDAAVVEALRRLLTDAALRARFGAAARALAVGRFSVASFEAQVRGVVASFEGRAPRAVLGAAEEARR